MKRQRIINTLLLLLATLTAMAQHSVWWIDNDYDGRTAVTASEQIELEIDISKMTPGVHIFNFRTSNSDGTEGALHRHGFVVAPEAAMYDYWIDNRTEQIMTAKADSFEVDLNGLSAGVHYLNVRPRHLDGTMGAVSRRAFQVAPSIAAYQYMFTADSLLQTVNVSPTNELTMQEQEFDIPVSDRFYDINAETAFRFDSETISLIRTDTTLFFMRFFTDERRQSEPFEAEICIADTIIQPIITLQVDSMFIVEKGDQGVFRAFKLGVEQGVDYTFNATQDCDLLLYQRIDSLPLVNRSMTTNEEFTLHVENGQPLYALIYNMVRDSLTNSSDSIGICYSAQNMVLDTVKTPTFSFESYNDIRIETETQDADTYYTMTDRMLAREETDFSNAYLSSSSGWNTWGDNMKSGYIGYGGNNDSQCLNLTSKTDSIFESAQAGYKFSDALKMAHYYMLTFKARSTSGEGQLQVYCQNDTLENTRSAADTLTIGKELADYEVIMKIENDKTNQFVLNFGAVADTYYIDNVQFGRIISDTVNNLRTRYEHPIEMYEGVNIKAVAVKQGMEDSAPAYYNYFYDGWNMLLEMWEWGRKICEDAYGDPNVPLQQVDEARKKSEDMFMYMVDRHDSGEHVDDSELMDIMSYMDKSFYEIELMRRGFTIDGVSYHAIDSTQVEVIAPLDYYTKYQDAIRIPVEVFYNDINFQVTAVAQGAFADSKLGAIVWMPFVELKYEDVAVMNNPNLLVYVNNAKLAPEGIQNIVIDGKAKNIVLKDDDNGDFFVPEPFTAESISYSREFKQATQIGVSRGWEGIALPFDVQTITHENAGVITPFSRGGDYKHFWLRRLSQSGLIQADKMEANTPYIIAMPNSSEYPDEFNLAGSVTLSAANITVPVTETKTLSLSDSTIMMAPTMKRLSRSSRYYAINIGEVRGQYLEGSVFERDYRAIRPFEAYTIHTSEGPASRFVPIMGFGGTTGIEDVRGLMSDDRGENWYDLNGRKLQKEPTRKGVYLNKGRKVVVQK